jgi:hypothetical protein
MTVLEMMQQDKDSVVGLDVSYEFGGTKPIVGKVVSTSKNKIEAMIDGQLSTWYTYGISFDDGGAYYTVDKFTQLLGDEL